MEVPKSQAAQQRLNTQTNGPKYPRDVYWAKDKSAAKWLLHEHINFNMTLVAANYLD
jgi:hypothetical protein